MSANDKMLAVWTVAKTSNDDPLHQAVENDEIIKPLSKEQMKYWGRKDVAKTISLRQESLFFSLSLFASMYWKAYPYQ